MFAALTVSSRMPNVGLVRDLIAIVFSLIGFGAGAVALFGIPRYGAKNILGSAIVGIILNSLVIFFWVSNFVRSVTAGK